MTDATHLAAGASTAPQRVPEFDTARGLGMVLVVLGHGWFASHSRLLHDVVYSFHMPLFYFLAGGLFSPGQSGRDFVIARAHALLKPYFVTLGLLGVAMFAWGAPPRYGAGNVLRHVSGILWASGQTIEWMPLWFLPQFFLTQCVVRVVLHWLVDRGARLCAGLALITWGCLAFVSSPGAVWGVDLLPVTVGWVILGNVLARPLFAQMQGRGGAVVAVAALFAFVTVWLIAQPTMDLNLRRHEGGYVPVLVSAFAGVALVCAVARGLPRQGLTARAAAYVGRGSLFVMLFHGPLQGRIGGSATVRLNDPFWGACIGLVGSLVVSLVIWEVIQRVSALRWLFLPPGKAVAHQRVVDGA